jgi:hypothetical protein
MKWQESVVSMEMMTLWSLTGSMKTPHIQIDGHWVGTCGEGGDHQLVPSGIMGREMVFVAE